MSAKDTIMTEIQHMENAVQESLRQVAVLEQTLKTRLLTIEKRERLENELEDVKQALKDYEEELRALRK